MRIDAVERSLCDIFCKTISVNPTEAGLAVSAFLADGNDDPLGFYIVNDVNGLHLEDDGSYLASLVAMDVDIHTGGRADFINTILHRNGAYWDADTFEIRTDNFSEEQLPKMATSFLAALARVRDVEHWTRDRVEDTFKQDVYNALLGRMGSFANLQQNEPIDPSLKDFPCDITIHSKSDPTKSAAIFVATGDNRLNEALLLKLEAKEKNKGDIPVIAMIEKINSVSQRKFQRAQNRDIIIPIYRDDESESIERIVRVLNLGK